MRASPIRRSHRPHRTVLVGVLVAGLLPLGALPASAGLVTSHPLCGTSVTTDLVLEEDLQCLLEDLTDGVALVVTGDGVTVDLRGHSVVLLDDEAESLTLGIVIDDAVGVRVENSSRIPSFVDGFDVGIVADEGSGNIIGGVEIIPSDGALLVDSASAGPALSVPIEELGVESGGVLVIGSDGTRVENVRVVSLPFLAPVGASPSVELDLLEVGSIGVGVLGSAGVQVRGSTVLAQGIGIAVIDSVDVDVRQNAVRFSEFGLAASYVEDVRLVDNRVIESVIGIYTGDPAFLLPGDLGAPADPGSTGDAPDPMSRPGRDGGGGAGTLADGLAEARASGIRGPAVSLEEWARERGIPLGAGRAVLAPRVTEDGVLPSAMDVSPSSIPASSAVDVLLRGNRVNDAYLAGILAFATTRTTLRGNIVEDTGQVLLGPGPGISEFQGTGIVVALAEAPTVTGNRLARNLSGMTLSSAVDPLVSGNRSRNDFLFGILVTEAEPDGGHGVPARNAVVRNSVTDDAWFGGMIVSDLEGATIDRNRVVGTEGDGFLLDDLSGSMTRNTVDRAIFAGFVLGYVPEFLFGPGATVGGADVGPSEVSGISGLTFTRNVAMGNGRQGFDTGEESEPVPGSRNRATRNGIPGCGLVNCGR